MNGPDDGFRTRGRPPGRSTGRGGARRRDLLVDLEPGADLLDLAGLDIELERLLGHPVDIVPARMLKPHVAPSALADAVEL